jgi:hypothetical protein
MIGWLQVGAGQGCGAAAEKSFWLVLSKSFRSLDAHCHVKESNQGKAAYLLALDCLIPDSALCRLVREPVHGCCRVQSGEVRGSDHRGVTTTSPLWSLVIGHRLDKDAHNMYDVIIKYGKTGNLGGLA